ncbi:MAG: hypothetical protein NT113_04120, partial [Hyphomicrobiales bacterium]|nr:hypothetical protein [Hyphomicrobiales bacterium]
MFVHIGARLARRAPHSGRRDDTRRQASGKISMSAQRFALSFRDEFHGFKRSLRLAAGLIVLAVPLA